MLADVSIRTSSVVIKEIIEASHQAFKPVHEISLEENKQFLSKLSIIFVNGGISRLLQTTTYYQMFETLIKTLFKI